MMQSSRAVYCFVLCAGVLLFSACTDDLTMVEKELGSGKKQNRGLKKLLIKHGLTMVEKELGNGKKQNGGLKKLLIKIEKEARGFKPSATAKIPPLKQYWDEPEVKKLLTKLAKSSMPDMILGELAIVTSAGAARKTLKEIHARQQLKKLLKDFKTKAVKAKALKEFITKNINWYPRRSGKYAYHYFDKKGVPGPAYKKELMDLMFAIIIETEGPKSVDLVYHYSGWPWGKVFSYFQKYPKECIAYCKEIGYHKAKDGRFWNSLNGLKDYPEAVALIKKWNVNNGL